MDTNNDFDSTISPLNFGINMAWEHRKFFLQIGAILILADMAIYKLASDDKFLSAEQTLVIAPVINLLLISLVLGSAAVLAITVGRNEAVNFKRIVFSASSYLPKISLSVVTICILMFFGATFIPLILIFLIWSPFLAIADFYVDGAEKPDNKIRVKALKSEPEDYNPLDILIGTDDDDDDDMPYKKQSFFDNSMMNIGLLRSASLSGGNFSAATYTTLVILLVLSINAMLLLSAQLASGNDAINFFTRIVASLSISFLAAIAAGSFVAILPETARKELKIKKLSEIITPAYQIKTDTKFLSIVIFSLLLSITGCYYLFKDLKQMPENVEITVAGTYIESGEAVIKLNITDNKRNFTWFVPNAFSVVWDNDNSTDSAAVQPTTPTGFAVTDNTNQPLQAISQNITQITLSMRVPYSQGAKSFELYYNNIFDVGGEKIFITKGSIKL